MEATKTAFKIENAPEFWKFVSVHVESGTFKSSEWVYGEIVKYGDGLSTWFKNREGSGLKTPSMSDEVQAAYRRVVAHVEGYRPAYPVNRKNEFYKDADGWVIAHALADAGTVVTQESAKTKGSKVKIPAVCDALEVRCIRLWHLIDELGYKAADYLGDDDE